MKKYKTWEAIKMLSENPKLKFQTDVINTNHINLFTLKMYFDNKGELIFKESNSILNIPQIITKQKLNYEWELVQEEVEFLHAMKARESGKTIYCIVNKTKKVYPSKYILQDINGFPLSSEEILEGHWYIQEDNEECED